MLHFDFFIAAYFCISFLCSLYRLDQVRRSPRTLLEFPSQSVNTFQTLNKLV